MRLRKKSAIHPQRLSGNEIPALRRKKHHRSRDVKRHTHSRQRCHTGPSTSVIARFQLRPFNLNRSGRNAIYCNPEFPQLNGAHLSKLFDSAFTSRVIYQMWKRDFVAA